MGQPLTQVERDLSRYAQERAYRLILDVVQAYEIAGESKSKAGACVGALFLRLAASFAVHCNADRERWHMMCDEVYDLAQQAKRKDNDD